MSNEDITIEFTEFVMAHDLDDEEYDALSAWVEDGNSPYTNPDHYCMDDREISFMKWYMILADPLHPEHKNLLDHRYCMEEDAGPLNDYPVLLKARAAEFMNMDYRDSTLNEGQDWYIGHSTFLSLEETKSHLLNEMEYYRDAIRELMYMARNVEDALSDMNLRGNLFQDVLIVGDVLGIAETCAEGFLKASKAIDKYEDQFRKDYFARRSHTTDDLPF